MAERRVVKQHRQECEGSSKCRTAVKAAFASANCQLSAPAQLEIQPPGRSRCPGHSGLKAGFTFKALSCAGNMLKVTSAITNHNHSPGQSSSSACP